MRRTEIRLSSHCWTFSVTFCTAFNTPNQWHVYDSISGANNYLMIDLAADEIRDVNAANIQISAALNKLDLDGVDWDQRAKLNLRLVDPNSRFVSCDRLHQFDSMTVLPEEVMLFAAVPFCHSWCSFCVFMLRSFCLEYWAVFSPVFRCVWDCI